jgi:hypothetical protein
MTSALTPAAVNDTPTTRRSALGGSAAVLGSTPASTTSVNAKFELSDVMRMTARPQASFTGADGERDVDCPSSMRRRESTPVSDSRLFWTKPSRSAAGSYASG